jgi:hypothetical protein
MLGSNTETHTPQSAFPLDTHTTRWGLWIRARYQHPAVREERRHRVIKSCEDRDALTRGVSMGRRGGRCSWGRSLVRTRRRARSGSSCEKRMFVEVVCGVAVTVDDAFPLLFRRVFASFYASPSGRCHGDTVCVRSGAT